MEKTTHTPGPWWALKDQDKRGWHGWRIDSDSRALMAWAAWPSEEERDSIEAESTARLIAAAPELLGALSACLWCLTLDSDLEEDFFAEIAQARAALAKATGGE
jgi:hypothetical protein